MAAYFAAVSLVHVNKFQQCKALLVTWFV